MPSRIFPFVNDQYYHVFNRGVDKKVIFDKKWDYTRFIKTIQHYQLQGPKPKFSRFLTNSLFKPKSDQKIVEIISYCLMPNHFHFLLKQIKDGGITEFVSKLSNSYKNIIMLSTIVLVLCYKENSKQSLLDQMNNFSISPVIST